MPAPTKFFIGVILATLLLPGCLEKSAAQRSPTVGPSEAHITVSLSPSVATAAVSGRLLVLFSKKDRSPINGPNWFSPEPFAGINVTDWKPGDSIDIPIDADAFPQALGQISEGKFFVQAVLKNNPDFAHHKNGVGNLTSSPASIRLAAGPNSIKLTLDQTVAPVLVRPALTQKIVSRRSDLLSAFHNRDVMNRALVLLPPSYRANVNKRYPVYYEITGFGGTIEDMLKRKTYSQVRSGDVEFIHVILTGQTEWGHHVYANSQTNGPRGDALVKELIPAIETEFRTVAKPHGRLLGGHSSGGWSSLWLQTHYPKFFGGVWSTSPDTVDFRDWQGTNLYLQGASVFASSNGQPRPLAIVDGKIMIWYRNFSLMDDVLQRGGQLRSFEAVFSPRGDDGLPMRCWDRETGVVDPAVIGHWRQYDISIYLKENWETLKGDLAGKIHVFIGQQDTFLLAEAVELLKRRMLALSSDAQIEIIPGKDHFNLLDPGQQERIYAAMAEKFRQGTAP